LRVLVACEFSGVVRDAFRARGHDAVSATFCDILPTEVDGPHYQGDVRDILADGWDLMVAHPPCTYLARSGARWFKDPARVVPTISALKFVMALAEAPIPRIAIENPIGRLNSLWRYPDQTVQPWMWGEPYSKATCLWLKNLPLLKPDVATKPDGITQWVSGSNYTRVSHTFRQTGPARSAKERSRTFSCFAEAMADQWGRLAPMSRELRMAA
jgi:hypothetical protein